MPRLQDLLEYLITPGLGDIWVLLDIKTPVPTFKEALLGRKTPQIDNYVDDLFRLIAVTLAETKPSRPWNQRVQVGCWAVGSQSHTSSKSNVGVGKIPSPLHQIPT
jgi:hypothetical protein